MANEDRKHEWVNKTKELHAEHDLARGKFSKMSVTIRLMKHHREYAEQVNDHPKFKRILLQKIEEFNQEKRTTEVKDIYWKFIAALNETKRLFASKKEPKEKSRELFSLEPEETPESPPLKIISRPTLALPSRPDRDEEHSSDSSSDEKDKEEETPSEKESSDDESEKHTPPSKASKKQYPSNQYLESVEVLGKGKYKYNYKAPVKVIEEEDSSEDAPPKKPIVKVVQSCKFSWCTRPRHKYQRCAYHLQQWRKKNPFVPHP
jgi:hypothetical protein